MYNKDSITKLAFFDLETASGYDSLNTLQVENPRMADLWSKRCEYLRSKFEENKELTDEELYENKAALHSEFNRIVCASFGRMTFINGNPEMIIKSYNSPSEIDNLNGISQVFTKFDSFKFCGHNIKRFDVPVMCKRLIINGLELPKYLRIHNMKPWEMPFVDTSELWSFGAWQEGFASLDLLSTSLGIDSPKDDIKGEDVTEVFWKEENYDRIKEYCEKDVYTLAQIILKLSNLPLLEGFESK